MLPKFAGGRSIMLAQESEYLLGRFVVGLGENYDFIA
tara:strand:- start:373 stop:483 length:111 start_codon:yes stop_codon:yes gene_type:complete